MSYKIEEKELKILEMVDWYSRKRLYKIQPFLKKEIKNDKS